MALECDLPNCTWDAVHGTGRCLTHYDPDRHHRRIPALLPLDGPAPTIQAITVIPEARPYQPEPAPADDEDKPDEYGQPVRFNGAAPVGLFGRIARWVRR